MVSALSILLLSPSASESDVVLFDNVLRSLIVYDYNAEKKYCTTAKPT
jgi:hypothetical protein